MPSSSRRSPPSDPRLARAGVRGYNQPHATPGHPTKSHVVGEGLCVMHVHQARMNAT